MSTVFLRILEADDKPAALLRAANELDTAGRVRFEVDPSCFASVPRSPFAYWVSQRLLGLFESLPALSSEDRVAASGGKTLHDFRWLRATWEVVPRQHSPWLGFAKGGAYSPFYSDVHLLLDWQDEARSLKEYLMAYRSSRGWSPNWTAELHGSEHYMRPGLTWPRRTNGLSVRALPAGCVFGDKGPALFVGDDDATQLLALASITNSRAFALLVSLQLARTELAQSYEVGIIQSTPVPCLAADARDNLATLARRAWSLKRSLDTRTETSHAFALPALLQVAGADVGARVSAWSDRVSAAEAGDIAIHTEIDESCFELYGIDEADRQVIREGLVAGSFDSAASEGAVDEEDDLEEEVERNGWSAEASTLVAELVSWAVGVAFGRFDVRLATGEREVPPEPEPFDPLPACSPGVLTGDDGLPPKDTPAAYPLEWSSDGIMVDDAGHPEDLAARVRDVFEVVFGAGADAWWQECVQLLGGDLRRWLARSFFETHLKSHSRSRRKAPIYWQLATPTGSYSVWLYAHRASPDSLFRVLNDIVTPKLRHEERKLTSLTQEVGPSPSTSQRKDIEAQRDFVEELRSFRGEVSRAAPLWRPELDDGVLITCAPLWRLVPQHRAWQREVRACWAKAANGEHDWAHLAMHLWPERVVPKCAHDRSLAIAHGLEEEFWAEDADGKWASRRIDEASVERLIQERSSAAVKAALADLPAAG